MAHETTVTGRKSALRPPRKPVMRGSGFFGGHGEHWHLRRDALGRYRSTARENPGGGWWLFGVIAAGAAFVGGIAYAASRPAGGGKQEPTPPGPKVIPQEPPVAQPAAGYAWRQLSPSRGSIDMGEYDIPQTAWVLVETAPSNTTITKDQLVNWLGSKGFNVYASWDRGVPPSGWPGSDASTVKAYALANAPKATIGGVHVWGVLKV
jgi:hypothetical protein